MKRMIAPIVIVIIIIAYLATIASLVFFTPELDDVVVGRVIASIVLTLVAGALIVVLWQRYKEIQKGEEDDLGKY